MALTKVEAAKLTNDLLTRGVIETVVKESPILGLLPPSLYEVDLRDQVKIRQASGRSPLLVLDKR